MVFFADMSLRHYFIAIIFFRRRAKLLFFDFAIFDFSFSICRLFTFDFAAATFAILSLRHTPCRRRLRFRAIFAHLPPLRRCHYLPPPCRWLMRLRLLPLMPFHFAAAAFADAAALRYALQLSICRHGRHAMLLP